MKRNNIHNNELAVNKNSGRNWVIIIYFCSGLCSLIDEVVWARLLKLTIGNTVYATTIVVSVFMGGLALGSLIMAQYADHIKRRLRLYAILEICVTITALSLPFALQFMDRFYQWFYLKNQPLAGTLLMLQVLVSAVILLVPAMLMGSTLPLLSRHVAVMKKTAGHLVGKLYALNTLGATLGCFLAGFVLIRLVGVMNTLFIAAGINLIVALAGWALSLSYDTVTQHTNEKTNSIQPVQIKDGPWHKKLNLLLFAVFASGFISIGYELIWMRSIAYRLGCYTYVFSAVLTIYLLGNVIGAWIGSRLSKRLKNPAAGFGLSLTFLGMSGLLFTPWISIFYHNRPLEAFIKFSAFKIAVEPLFHCLLLFLIPSIMMGIGFPLAIQTWNNHKQKVGQTTGNIYGTNTIGAVLGGVITGFLLIPFLGSQMSVSSLGMAGVWTGVSLLLIYDHKTTHARRFACLALAVLFTAASFLIPPDLLNRSLIQLPGFNTIAIKEGVTTTASVRETIYPDSQKRALGLATSNMIIGGDGPTRSAQKALGHLGVLLNKHSKDVLSIGFGTGETTDCLARYKLNQIDCVEIAPELVDIALKYFSHINLGNRLNHKVNMIYMDAKNYLHLTPKTYDLIINGANRPAQPGSAPMFAKEHFENTLAHLNNGGLVMTKLHLSAMSRSSFESIIGTFLEVFPHVTIWFPVTRPQLFFYLAGSREKQMFSPKYIENQLDSEHVKASTAYMNFQNSVDVLSCYVGDRNDLERYLKDYRINSDYMPFLEFNIEGETNLILNGYFNNFLDVVRRGSLPDHIDWSGMSRHEKERWVEKYDRLFIAISYLLDVHSLDSTDFFKRFDLNSKGLKRMPNYPALLDQQEDILNKFKNCLNRKRKAGWINPEKALLMANAQLRRFPDSGALWLVKSWAFKEKNNLQKALNAAEIAAQYSPDSVLVQENIGDLFLKLGHTDKSIYHFQKALEKNRELPMLYFKMGEAFSHQGNISEAVKSFQKALSLNPKFKKAEHSLKEIQNPL